MDPDVGRTPAVGVEYRFGFGPGYDWRGMVSACDDGRWIEWEMTEADQDWTGTRVGVRVSEAGASTVVDFYHTGWRHANDHYRTSSCCWAQYLRVLRRFLEHGERVEYDVGSTCSCAAATIASALRSFLPLLPMWPHVAILEPWRRASGSSGTT